jgi:hypothetical protein
VYKATALVAGGGLLEVGSNVVTNLKLRFEQVWDLVVAADTDYGMLDPQVSVVKVQLQSGGSSSSTGKISGVIEEYRGTQGLTELPRSTSYTRATLPCGMEFSFQADEMWILPYETRLAVAVHAYLFQNAVTDSFSNERTVAVFSRIAPVHALPVVDARVVHVPWEAPLVPTAITYTICVIPEQVGPFGVLPGNHFATGIEVEVFTVRDGQVVGEIHTFPIESGYFAERVFTKVSLSASSVLAFCVVSPSGVGLKSVTVSSPFTDTRLHYVRLSRATADQEARVFTTTVLEGRKRVE